MKATVAFIISAFAFVSLSGKDVTFEMVTDDMFPPSSPASCLATADFDQDGCYEVLVSSYLYPAVRLYEQNSPGSETFNLIDDAFLPVPAYENAFFISVLDYDNDGLLDVILKDPPWPFQRFEQCAANSFSFVFQDDDIQMEDGEPIVHAHGVFIDVDENGLIDYLAVDTDGLVRYEQLADNPNLYHLYDGFFLGIDNEPMGTGCPAFGNIDGDDELDMLISSYPFARWYERSVEDFTFANRGSIETLFEDSGRSLTLVDVDNNGVDDLLSNGNFSNSGDVWFWRNTTYADIDDDMLLFTSVTLSASPNPFNPTTTIHFEMTLPGYVTLEVYNVRGQRVATLVDGHYFAGQHEVVWNAEGCASGAYFCVLKSARETVSQKILLLK